MTNQNNAARVVGATVCFTVAAVFGATAAAALSSPLKIVSVTVCSIALAGGASLSVRKKHAPSLPDDVPCGRRNERAWIRS